MLDMIAVSACCLPSNSPKPEYTMEKKQTRTSLERELKAAGDVNRAKQVALYFKTGKGEYGEGDVFLGIPVPAMRRIALKYRALTLAELQKLLDSKIHEHRAAASRF